MSRYKILSVFVLVTIMGISCGTPVNTSTEPHPAPTLTPTFTRTATTTPTPTITPSPTVTFTPSPTAIAGGSGNLLLSCIDTNDVKKLRKIFIYNIETDTLNSVSPDTPRPNGMPTKMSLHSEEILAASPSGQVVIWKKCEFEEPYGYCREYISDSTFSINKRFVPVSISLHRGSHQFISDDILLFWTSLTNTLGYERAADLYLLDINTNEKKLLIKNEDENRGIGDFFLSPSGEFVAFDYYLEILEPEKVIEIIDVSNHKILEYKLHGSKPNWVTQDSLMYYDDKLYNNILINVITGKTEEYHWSTQISPDGKWLAYINYSRQGLKIIIESIFEETTITIYDSNFYNARVRKWSPDGGKIIYSIYPLRRNASSIEQTLIYDLETNTTNMLIEVDTNDSQGYQGFQDISWSHDGQWFTISVLKPMSIDEKKEYYIKNAFDYYICNEDGCKLLEPPNTTYCSYAVWTN